MKNKLYKDLILIFIMGSLYMILEGIWRGWTHISMMIVGGLCAFIVGRLNEHSAFYNRKMIEECLIGTFITVCIEFLSGLILNIWLNLNIWDYSNQWGNLYGQICIQYTLLWFLLMPFCIYIDDYLRYKLFNEKRPLGLFKNYADLFLLR